MHQGADKIQKWMETHGTRSGHVSGWMGNNDDPKSNTRVVVWFYMVGVTPFVLIVECGPGNDGYALMQCTTPNESIDAVNLDIMRLEAAYRQDEAGEALTVPGYTGPGIAPRADDTLTDAEVAGFFISNVTGFSIPLIMFDGNSATHMRNAFGKDPAPELMHEAFKTGDEDAPSSIKDENGDVVLDMCRKCRRAEIELDDHPLCSGTPTPATLDPIEPDERNGFIHGIDTPISDMPEMYRPQYPAFRDAHKADDDTPAKRRAKSDDDWREDVVSLYCKLVTVTRDRVTLVRNSPAWVMMQQSRDKNRSAFDTAKELTRWPGNAAESGMSIAY